MATFSSEIPPAEVGGVRERVPGRPMRILVTVLEGEADAEPANRWLTLAEVEARHIAEVLEHVGGRIKEAARILGIHRNTLARKIKRLRLVRPNIAKSIA